MGLTCFFHGQGGMHLLPPSVVFSYGPPFAGALCGFLLLLFLMETDLYKDLRANWSTIDQIPTCLDQKGHIVLDLKKYYDCEVL